MKRFLYFAAPLAIAVLATLATVETAQAELFARLAAAQEEVPPPPGAAPAVTGMVPCDACITYKCRALCSRRWACCDTYETVLRVVDPCSGSCCEPCCFVDVPICLPACCEGEPCVKSRCGLCGRGVVVYEWCCGYKVKVIFGKCGEVKVIS